ncbi:hypothetical protein COU00_03470 [Candidatus Falkowbacteria bacterium CG10_big_fil_rev_8_21_14_0_10_43_11]|uniref:Uncharacterized protein n=1 Tax=Candidatus Falkowbacteria bacterium CG10_big_fil_rev_8_21_14_0_10_43_11 TaxID=1974568 RepID=A0A2M6WLD9_9BACT|nr:MAG: hypothetical protein COU00_03470 [Candidatus Falkowbacteria bacterium CG10_big_fil_rev_8_21_14_0_10_43_11]
MCRQPSDIDLTQNLTELAQNLKTNEALKKQWRLIMPHELLDLMSEIADQGHPATNEQVRKYFDFLEHDPRDNYEQSFRVAR